VAAYVYFLVLSALSLFNFVLVSKSQEDMSEGHHDHVGHDGGAHEMGGHVEHIDHSSHTQDNQHSAHDGMMTMYFHGGYNEVILFSFWKISSVGGLVGSMFGVFILGVLYEGLKFYREFLMRRNYNSVAYAHVSEGGGSEEDGSHVEAVGGGRGREVVKIIQTSVFSRAHFLQTFLHLLQVILSYMLMLIAMTFNTWLCLAVASGAMFGYFLFGWKKTVMLDVGGEGCH